MNTNLDEKLYHIDGGSIASTYGWLLHDGSIYFISNEYSRAYDDSGRIYSYTSVGGNMSMRSVCLSDGEITDWGILHNVNKLTEYYPDAPYSTETYMKGLFDNKIYFTVSFRASYDYETGIPTNQNYVTYYDLNTNTYHGEPEDYTNIDNGMVTYVSNEYLAITNGQQTSVYKVGMEQPVVFTDESFNEFQVMTVFDDTLYCAGKAFDLNTREIRTLDGMGGKTVLARFEDYYIISETYKQYDFEKIPMTNLLSE